MELKNLNTQTTWEVASDTINQNNGKINEAVTRLEYAAIKGKGYFKTVQQLEEAYPAPGSGSWAFVGVSFPFTVYSWNGVEWSDSGISGGDENLNLNNYYTMDEAKAMFVGSDNVRMIETRYTQEQIEQMDAEGTLDPNTLYIALE